MIILQFWQIGCTSCRLECPPSMASTASAGGKGWISRGGQGRPAKRHGKGFAAELNFSYPLLIDTDGKSAALFGVTDIPRTCVIDRNGTVRYRTFGGPPLKCLKN